MMKLFYLFLAMICLNHGFSCLCAPESYANSFIKSDFVGRVLVTEVYNTEEFGYDINFEVLELFKGQKIDSVTVLSGSKDGLIRTSCDIYLSIGEEWIIFASKNDSGALSFGMCSNSNLAERFSDWEIEILRDSSKIELNTFFSETELEWPPFLDSTDAQSVKQGYQSKHKMVGNVYLKIDIDTTGSVIDILTVKSENKKLEKEAREIVKDFKPITLGRLNGYSVPSDFFILIRFISEF